MQPFRNILGAGLVLAIAFGSVQAGEKKESAPETEADVLAVLQKAGRFKTFLRAVRVAGLTERVKQLRDVTLFAPNDQAFAQLPPGTLQMLLSPAHQDKLQAVILTHFAKTQVDREALAKASRLDTLQGRKLEIRREEKTLRVDVAEVSEGQWQSEGLVVHEIAQVISP